MLIRDLSPFSDSALKDETISSPAFGFHYYMGYKGLNLSLFLKASVLEGIGKKQLFESENLPV